MACHLYGAQSSQHLTLYWFIVDCTLSNKLQWKCNQNETIFIQDDIYENFASKSAILFLPKCVGCSYLTIGWKRRHLIIKAGIILGHKLHEIICNYYHILLRGWYLFGCVKPMMTSSNRAIFRVTDHLCGEFTGPGEFPAQRPVTRSFDVFFDLHPNKRLSEQWRGWWFETPSHPLWRHRKAFGNFREVIETVAISLQRFWKKRNSTPSFKVWTLQVI